MMDRPHQANPPAPSRSMVQRSDTTFYVDAELIGELLNVSAAAVPVLMHEGAITSVCERGIDDHDGEFRLTFFHRSRRARLSTDVTGRVLRRSAIDFGDRPIPSALRRPGG
ncbi:MULTISPECIES: DUF6522 family protein [Bradyrhizobium]|uniref:DUF6522 family protein n=1 Tax=Bradyrhizobium TaxID=374 RepID=UPI001FDF8DAF|nr:MULTISPECIES: DUF6522 family protein [Bradyrhizobium]